MIIERRKCKTEELLSREKAVMKISAISIPAMTRIARQLIRIWNSLFCMELPSRAHALSLSLSFSPSLVPSLSPWLEYSCGKNAFDYLIATTRRAYKIINVRQLQTYKRSTVLAFSRFRSPSLLLHISDVN